MNEKDNIPQILIAHGWSKAGGAYFIKTNPRLGWVEDTATFIIGYYQFPKPIDTADKMLKLLELLEV